MSTAVVDWPTAMATTAARNSKVWQRLFSVRGFFFGPLNFLSKFIQIINNNKKNGRYQETQHSGSFENLAADLSVHFSFVRSIFYFFSVQRDNFSIDVRHNSRIEFFGIIGSRCVARNILILSEFSKKKTIWNFQFGNISSLTSSTKITFRNFRTDLNRG